MEHKHVCHICNTEFTSSRKNQKLCSKQCVSENKSRCLKKDDIVKTCEFCNVTYIACKKTQRFCSKSCQYDFTRVEIVPRVIYSCCMCSCDVLRRSTAIVGKNVYCSVCFKKHRIGHKPSEEHRRRISETRKRDWAKGIVYKDVAIHSYRNVKWYEHVKPTGDKVKLQGTWELMYAKYLDESKISYEAHKGAIWYVRSSDNTKHVYLPDFYLPETDEYIDVKNDFVANVSIKKFEDIRRCNPNTKIRILTNADLKSLGLL